MSVFGRFVRRPKPYRLEDLARRERFRSDYDIVADYLLDHLEFDSAIDLGCSNGFLLERFFDAGKSVAGVDVAPDVQKIVGKRLNGSVRVADFGSAEGSYDLACCVEVAEHIAPERSEALVGTLARLASTWIYFSAAPVGQAGRGHINCRPRTDWLSWFEAEGWILASRESGALESHLGRLKKASWLQTNSFLLQRSGG